MQVANNDEDLPNQDPVLGTTSGQPNIDQHELQPRTNKQS
jgi:hypothetical protein